MNYKNIIFDFGNVVGSFDADYILNHYVDNKKDFQILSDAIFHNWPALDAGTVDYDQVAAETIAILPNRLKGTAHDFYDNWFQYVNPLSDTWDFIHELKVAGYSIYLLSNASTRFAEVAKQYYSILNEFDGIVFSAPLKLAKPDPAIYRYLFDTYQLKPEECFFLDDLAENIAAGQALGMNGIVFTGDIPAVKKAIGF
ncbi:HAD family phosphatase [Lachnospiraceae bacterium OF09-6]|nr:HAD family phosphatase [Lachnospiraceae bacterium OF09-6]